jgi:hypothetical protein
MALRPFHDVGVGLSKGNATLCGVIRLTGIGDADDGL